MAVVTGEVQTIDLFQVPDPFQIFFTEWGFAVKGMKHNAFQQIPPALCHETQPGP